MANNRNNTPKFVSNLTDEQFNEIASAFTTVPVVKAETPKADKGKDCACGCGGRTKGGTFLPGHDAKFHSAQKAAAGQLKKMPRPCGCGCGNWTKGGFFVPGHDAKLMSKMMKSHLIQPVTVAAGTNAA